MILIFVAQINMTYSSTNMTVHEGSNAILACSVSGDPRPAVVWSHDQHSSRKDVECLIEEFSTGIDFLFEKYF